MAEFLIPKTRSVAIEHVAPLAVELGKSGYFPWEIWKKLGEAGILGLGVPKEYGGSGSSAEELSCVLHELVFSGGNIGIGLSALIHNIVAGYVISPFASKAFKEKILPLMADGRSTCSFAVSEPGRGGHPKLMETMAERIDGASVGYLLKGEKTYLTNGPVADFFAVIAVSGTEAGRKEFTAFLADSSAHGIEKLQQMDIPFFRPSPHGGIKIDSLFADEEHILGSIGKAYDEIVMPFREVEDAIMAGLVSGAIRRLVSDASMIASKANAEASKDAAFFIGRMNALSELACDLSLKMASSLDRGDEKETQRLLYFQFREICGMFNNLTVSFEKIIPSEHIDAKGNEIYWLLRNDLIKSSGLGDYILKANLVKYGRNIIEKKCSGIQTI